jgi:hypothetical protein
VQEVEYDTHARTNRRLLDYRGHHVMKRDFTLA